MCIDCTTNTPQTEPNELRKCCTNPHCERAGQPLPLSEFHTHKDRKDGYASQCKMCIKRLQKERYTADRIVPPASGTKQCSKITCRRVGQDLPVAEFNKRTCSPDGYSHICRECAIEQMKKQRRKPDAKEKAARYQREFRQTEKGKSIDNRGHQRYRQTAKGKKNTAKRQKEAPEKMAARKAVYSAVQKGVMPHISTRSCHHCGNPAKEYHHYLGYSSEHHLDVVPVCKNCHAQAHFDPSCRKYQ